MYGWDFAGKEVLFIEITMLGWNPSGFQPSMAIQCTSSTSSGQSQLAGLRSKLSAHS